MLNRVVLMGRMVADPELKTTNTGVSVCSFRIAVDRNYVKNGEQRQTDFFDIVAWRSSAEFVCKHFAKGSLIAVDGQLQSRNYQTKDGQNRTAIEVVAENISFTGERRDTAPQANESVVSTPQPQYAPQPDHGRQQHLSETEYQQQRRDFPGSGGMPSDGGYYAPDGDLPF